MAKYEVTFSCGHIDTVHLFGPNADRERKLEWYKNYGLCPECFKKQKEEEKKAEEQRRREESEAAAAYAKKMGLPDLVGSEKQIEWANTIRQRYVEQYQEVLTKYSDKVPKKEIEEMKQKVYRVLNNIVNASDWIDNRENLAALYEKSETDSGLFEIKQETTIRPENCRFSGAVEIKVYKNRIETIYLKNDEFRAIVKALDYEWDGENRCWARNFGVRSGDVSDRAAEIGNKLLLAGFAIQIQDEEIRQKAITGTYEPECKRWITLLTEGSYKSWLCISWEKNNEGLHKKARSLPENRWVKPYVVVPIKYYNEILDFADIYGFKISLKAQEAIENYRANIETVTPNAAPEPEQLDKLREILKSSKEILEDLRDD